MKKAVNEEGYINLHGLDDYDRWKEVHAVLSKTQSQFVKERLAKNVDMFSNGETAMRYFTEHIDRDAIYLLDEPENSLSPQNQLQLKYFIEDSVRNFGCQFVISTHSLYGIFWLGLIRRTIDNNNRQYFWIVTH